MTLSKYLCLLLASVWTVASADPPAPVPPDPVEDTRNQASRAMERMREGDDLLRADDLRGACRAYQDTAEILPAWWMPRLAVARCGRFVGLPLEEIVEHARYAAQARPRLAVTQTQLGLILEETGQHAEAIAAYTTAIRQNSGLFETRFRLALLLVRLGQFSAAREHLEAVVRVRPAHVAARWQLARVYEEQGFFEGAEELLSALVLRSRFPALALSRLIRFYQRRDRQDDVARRRAEYLRAFPGLEEK